MSHSKFIIIIPNTNNFLYKVHKNNHINHGFKNGVALSCYRPNYDPVPS